MQVASLELCKELYELSEWDGTQLVHDYSSGTIVYYPSPVAAYHINDTLPYENIPAYDLSYLLRKLPRKFDNTNTQVLFLMLAPSPPNNTQWVANYGGTDYLGVKPYECFDDTPEDALCALAIELFKQGVLKHD